jgi:hypothetical protein
MNTCWGQNAASGSGAQEEVGVTESLDLPPGYFAAEPAMGTECLVRAGFEGLPFATFGAHRVDRSEARFYGTRPGHIPVGAMHHRKGFGPSKALSDLKEASRHQGLMPADVQDHPGGFVVLEYGVPCPLAEATGYGRFRGGPDPGPPNWCQLGLIGRFSGHAPQNEV